MGWTSTAPAALNALTAIATAGLVSDKTRVQLGPVITGTAKPEAVMIGWADEKTDSVEHTFPEPGYTPDVEEQFRINCMIQVVTGDAAKIPDTITRAYQLLAAVADLIYADPTLGDVVMQCVMGPDVACRMSQEEVGFLAALPFVVTCDSFTGN